MKDNDIIKVVNHTIKETMKHKAPSPQTTKELNQINIFMIGMKKDIDFIKKAVVCIKKDLRRKACKEELNELKKTVEKLKAFRWQIIAGAAVALWAFETFANKLI